MATSSTDPSQADLDRWQQLTDAATDGWTADVYRRPSATGHGPEITGGRVFRGVGDLLVTDHVHRASDAEFIAEARTAMPSLLASVVRERQRADDMVKRHKALLGELRAARIKLDAVEAEIATWKHDTVEDCWYSCAATYGTEVEDACCNSDMEGRGCSCGLDGRRGAIRSVLAALCTCPASSLFNGPSQACPTHGSSL